jgi:hypothetical protein
LKTTGGIWLLNFAKGSKKPSFLLNTTLDGENSGDNGKN